MKRLHYLKFALTAFLPSLLWGLPATEAPKITLLNSAVIEDLDDGEFTGALPLVKNAAHSGDRDAMLYLSLMYRIGVGVEIDADDSVLWLRRAAEAGNGTAALELLKEDDISAVESARWHALSALSKSHTKIIPASLATRQWGSLSPNYTYAAQWNLERRDSADSAILYNLAQYTLRAPHILKTTVDDYPPALLRAADAGSIKAMNFARILLQFEKGRMGFQPDLEASRKYLLMAANAGDAESQYELGDDLLDADSPNHDVATGLKFLNLSADQNYAEALNKLGRIYSAGIVVEQDRTQALAYRLRGAELNHIDCLDHAAWHFEYGYGTAQDLPRAFELFRRSSKLGSDWGKFRLGRLTYSGLGTPQDIDAGLAMIEEAANSGSRSAMEFLGEAYFLGEHVEKNLELAFEWTEKAAQEGDDSAQFQLGWWLIKGIGVEADPEEAITWFEFAANDGHLESMRTLWQMHLGKYGGPVNPEKADHWREQARAAGDHDAQALSISSQLKADPENIESYLSQLVEMFEHSEIAVSEYIHALQQHPEISRLADDNLMENIQRYVDSGSVAVSMLAGALLIAGRHDVPADPLLGEEILIPMAETGIFRAQHILFTEYLYSGSNLHDPGKAQTWKEKYVKSSPKFAAFLRQDSKINSQVDPTPEQLAQLRAKFRNRPKKHGPQVVFQSTPIYPIEKRIMGEEGEVLIEFIITDQGEPAEVTAKSSSDPLFEPAAIAAVKRWRFVPGLKKGKPVNTRMTVPIIFSITD